MSRGFAGGLLWGGIVAVLGLGVVSQVAPLPQRPGAAPTDETTLGNVPAVAETATVDQQDAPAPEPQPTEAEAAEAPPVDTAPAQSAPPADMPPDEIPATGPVDSSAAVDMADAPAAETADAPAAGGEQAHSTLAATPEAPAADTSVPPQAQAEPAPAAPPAAPEAPAAPLVEASPAPGTEADGGMARAESTTPPVAPQDEPGPALAELPPAPPEEPLLTPPPAGENPAPAEIAMAEPEAEAPAAPEPVAPDAATGETPPEADPQSQTGAALPEIILPDPGLPPVTGRLPRIGDAAEPAAEAPVAELAPDGPPVERFARKFDNPDNKPAFAILLIDTGGPQLDREKLAALPFPVTFLIDPLSPDAAAAEAIYRAAGQEVAMLATGIPEGATAADLEQTFQANAAILTQAVAIADLPAGGFQDNRPLASQVVPVVKAQGRGLVTFDRGLNAANQVALREDVPAALIFRLLDGEGEATPVIRRYLDRAAFKAAQEGRVAVLGETRPETIAALLEWTVEGRAAQVALAPLTAVLATD